MPTGEPQTQFMSMVACYGGAPDAFDVPWQPIPLEPIVIPAGYPIPTTPGRIEVYHEPELTDAERRGLAKLLPIVEAALVKGAKLDRDQIAAFVLLGKIAEDQ